MLLILILVMIWVILISLSPPNTLINNRYTSKVTLCILFIYVSVLLITTENTNRDMMRYLNQNYNYSFLSLSESLKSTSSDDMGFVIFQWITVHISSDPRFFYFSIWLIFGSLLILSLKKILKPWQLTIVFFAYLNFFLTFYYITNTIRQGLAISIILVAVTSLIANKNKKWLFYLSIIVAPFFHDTAIALSLILLFLRFFNVKVKTVVIIWVFFALTFLTSLNSVLLSPLSSYVEDLSTYSSDHIIGRYGGGVNRLDFFVFSAFWLVYALFFYRKIKNDRYKTLIKVYGMFNIFFLAFGFIGYSDRIASYSWLLIPLLVFYPLFLLPEKHKQRLLVASATIVFIITSFLLGSLLYNQPVFY